jgi:nucleoside 2-deoxyribosyltransferase
VVSKLEKCPLCDQDADFNVGYVIDMDSSVYAGKCERCGSVHVTDLVVREFRETKKLHLLSALFRRNMGKLPLVTLESVKALIAGMPQLRTVPEKMNGLLRLLADSKLPPGTPITFDAHTDYPLVFAANWQEANFLLGQLSSRRFISLIGATANTQVTADGYERVEQLEAASFKSTRNAFVAMWFDKSRDVIYNEAIEPAVREAGYQAIRIDRTEHVNRIDDEIISQLRQSRFVVADFTEQRAGVYYEAGFMHGLGRNVFWMVEKQQLGKVHFDVRQYNFIDYDSPADAKGRLYYRIMAVEGKGPGRVDAGNSASD